MTKRQVAKNIATLSTAHFQRQELKFFVDNHIIEALIPEFNAYIERDHYSAKGSYPIYSVYFDTEDWQAFYSKLAGNKRRQKFRIRSYYKNPKPDEPVFVEIKEKDGGTVYKRRSPVNLSEVEELIKGRPISVNTPVIDEWRFAVLRNSLKPKLLNSYNRLAFASKHFPGLRVTIDQDLAYSVPSGLDFAIPTRKAYWANGKSVVEIKFDRYVPKFIVEIIRRYNLTQVPVSKYCDSVISHYLLF